MSRLALTLGSLALMAGAVGACTSTTGTNGKDYVAGDGSVEVIAAGQRGEPVQVAGESLSGDKLDLAEFRGTPVVINVWWSGCGPCRAEAPQLAEAADKLDGRGRILGINVRDDSRENPLAFERTYNVTYPSLYDPGSELLLDFPAPYNPRFIPSTIVLDRDGRVAAVIRGQLPSTLTVLELVDELAAESA